MSDWIEHDGAAPPRFLMVQGLRFHVKYLARDQNLALAPHFMNLDEPQWLWRWKRVRIGWFRTELRRVCDDPSCAPIIAYQIIKPRALLDLIELVETLPAPVQPMVDA